MSIISKAIIASALSASTVAIAQQVQLKQIANINTISATTILKFTACNGSGDDTSGFAAAAASNSSILVPTGATCIIGTSMVVPPGSPWSVEKGAQINVGAGQTMVFYAPFNSGRYKIFYGAGSVIGISPAKPDWWGVNAGYGNTSDSQPGFQKATNSALATYSPSSPTMFADISGKPKVDIGQGFYNLCSPVDIYPNSSNPIEFSGIGPWNSGSVLTTCATFAGYAPILVHGNAFSSGQVEDVYIHDISVRNIAKTSGATAGIRYVPENSGYYFNPLHKSSLIDNVSVQGFPINLDLVNTLNTKITRSSFLAGGVSDTSNTTGVRIFASGSPSNGNSAGEIAFEDITVAPCPLTNAITCSNTINFDFESSGGAKVNAINMSRVINEASNTFYKLRVDGAGSWLGDMWWDGSGNQNDGFACNYIDAIASNQGFMFNAHIEHVYNTGVYANTCVANSFIAQPGGSGSGVIQKIWMDGNQFVLGNSSKVIYLSGVNGFALNGNIIDGSNTSSAAIQFANGSQNGTVNNNVILGSWFTGISATSSENNITVIGNNCKGATLSSACATDGAPIATTTNNIFGNGDKFIGGYAPTVTCLTGSLTAYSANGSYTMQDGKLHVAITLADTTNGSCAGRLQISLPRAPFGNFSGSGNDATGNKTLTVNIPDFDPTAYVYAADGTYPGATGHNYNVNVSYQIR